MAAQTYGSIEHIVKDGGSSDGSVEVLKQSPDVVWTSARDFGQSAALNEAFELSRGAIIGWLNADDAYYHPRVVARVVATFEAHPEVDVVYGHAALVNADGLILHFLWAPPFNRKLLRSYNFIYQPTVFIRRTSIVGVLVDETFDYSMDRELWLRLSRSAAFKRIDDILAVDRHHLGRKSHLRKDLARRDQVRLERVYGEPLPEKTIVRTQLLKIAVRFAGLSLVRDRHSELAFEGYTDKRSRLVLRQIGQRRAWMPIESEIES